MELYLLSETFESIPVNYFCSLDKELLNDLLIYEEEANTDVSIKKVYSDIDSDFIKQSKELTDKGIQVCLQIVLKDNELFLTKEKFNDLDFFNIMPVEFCI